MRLGSAVDKDIRFDSSDEVRDSSTIGQVSINERNVVLQMCSITKSTRRCTSNHPIDLVPLS